MQKLEPFSQLKLQIQKYGPLTNEAWEEIQRLVKIKHLKRGESFHRHLGEMGFVADGIIKEYDAELLSKPVILNFICSNSFIVTKLFNQKYYCKSSTGATVLYLDNFSLKKLYVLFPELESVYDAFVSEYYEGFHFRAKILSFRHANERVEMFISRYRHHLAYLTKPEMANYTALFIDTFSKTLRACFKKQF